MRIIHPRLSAFIGGLSITLLAGCASDEASSTDVKANQDRALKDPFSYGPSASDMMNPNADDQLDRTNISGGGIGEYDGKGMKKDLDSLFGP